jgi:hypothetical protein
VADVAVDMPIADKAKIAEKTSVRMKKPLKWDREYSPNALLLSGRRRLKDSLVNFTSKNDGQTSAD